MTLPVAQPWYATAQIAPNLWCVTEPHVHPIFSANMFLVLGRDADLVIDSGMGVAPLRPVLDALRLEPAKPLKLFTTHAHVDHIGAAHEFDHQMAHVLEAAEIADPAPYSLISDDIRPALREMFKAAGYATLWPALVDARPTPDYDIASYELRPSVVTEELGDGDMVDLGDWQAEVLHLPGHSPGQIGLWHAESGTLFGADAIYDGPLIYEGPGMDVQDYTATLRRIRALPVSLVLGGHDGPFGQERCHAIIDHYLALWR